MTALDAAEALHLTAHEMSKTCNECRRMVVEVIALTGDFRRGGSFAADLQAILDVTSTRGSYFLAPDGAITAGPSAKRHDCAKPYVKPTPEPVNTERRQATIYRHWAIL